MTFSFVPSALSATMVALACLATTAQAQAPANGSVALPAAAHNAASVTAPQVVAHYAHLVHSNYGDTLAAAYPNVNRITGDLNAMTFPEPLDVVFMGQEYHDFVIPRFNVDVAKMNTQVFAALKPGGLYVILDHQAAPGAGTSVVGTLHRIEASALRAQVEAAGFIFDGETNVVANPEDDHSLSVFDDKVKGKTDQFVYRFRKPA